MIIKFTGAATVGLWRIPYFCSSIQLMNDKLVLNASFMGIFVFEKEDIINFQLVNYGIIQGIFINHRSPLYEKDLYFWPLKKASIIIEDLKKYLLIQNEKSGVFLTNLDIDLIKGKPVFKRTFFISILIIQVTGILITYFLKRGNKDFCVSL